MLCRLFLFYCLFEIIAAVSRPPTLLQQPPKEGSFIINEALKLPCVAEADPTAEYVWFKNGRIFNEAANSGRYTVWPGLGTLIFIRPQMDDDGYYQCTAKNEFGKAVSVRTNLRRVEFKDFPSTSGSVKNVPAGKSVTLPCSKPTSYPSPTVSWTYIESGSVKNVIPSARTAIDLVGNLVFANVKAEDADRKYQCVVRNPRLNREKTSASIMLNVLNKDNPVQVPTKIAKGSSPKINDGVVNKTFEFICLFSGNPTPTMTWKFVQKNGVEVDPSTMPFVRVDQAGVILKISKVLEMHEGTYRCRGQNYGSDMKTNEFAFYVHSAPKFVQRPQNTMAPPGSSVTFNCAAHGKPTPNVNWFRNGAPFSSKDPRISIESNKLIMSNLVTTDSCVIQCNATNEFGYDFVDFYINVVQEKPEFIAKMRPLTVLAEGQQVVLNCSTYSAPPAEVRWTRAENNQQLTGGRYDVLGNGNLVIKDLKVADSGKYVCVASNPFGQNTTQGVIEVRRRTRITVPPKDVRIYERSDVKFVCSAETDPLETRNLKISWIKDGSPIDFTQQLRVRPNPADNSLIIGGVGPLETGSYTCVASNGIDKAEASASLVVQGRPNPPRDVTVLCTMGRGKREATVSWISGSDNSAPILKYEVEFADLKTAPNTWYPVELVTSTDDSKDKKPGSGSVNPSAVVKMNPGITYRFRVRARNIVGLSEPSPPSEKSCVNNDAAPTKNPTNLWAEGTQKSNIIVHWTPMSVFDYNAPEMKYLIAIKCLNCLTMPKDKVNSTTVKPYVNNLEFLNSIRVGARHFEIEVYKQYEVSIRAINKIGESSAKTVVAKGYSGEAAPSVKATSFEEVPKSAKNVDMDNQVTLKWQVPNDIESSEDVKGFFRGYRVEWCLASEPSAEACEENKRYQDHIVRTPKHPLNMIYGARRRRSVDALLSRWRRATKTMEFTLKRLPGNTAIKAWVRILNKRYAGPPSNVIDIKTATGVPGPVELFKLKSRGVTHLSLEWQLPNQTNGPITGFQMGVQQIKALDLGYLKRFPVISDPNLLSGEVAGLKPKSPYRVFIWAETSAGFGVPTFLDATTSPANVLPGAPSMTVSSVGETAINVTYVPSQKGVPGSVFYAQYRLPGRSKWEETYREFSRGWIEIKELPTDTVFVVRMVATNGAGLTAFSDEVMVRTGGSSASGLSAASSTWFIIILCLLLLLIGGIIALCYFRRHRYQQVMGSPVPQEDPDNDKHDFGYDYKAQEPNVQEEMEPLPMPPPQEMPHSSDLPSKEDLSGPIRQYENVNFTHHGDPDASPPRYQDTMRESPASEEEWSRPPPSRRVINAQGPPRPPPPSGPPGSGSGAAINSSSVVI